MSIAESTRLAAQACEKNFPSHLEDLKKLARIPSVSFDGFPPEEVRKGAQAVAELLKKCGCENVELLEFPGAHPYVYGEWMKAGPGAPTALLYAHHDVQPPGREELWKTPPWEPTEKEGPGGLRLYGRGAADDKAGVIVHTAAIASYLETAGKLPINVKLIIEGEEESGSTHLGQCLQKYKDQLKADVMILTDTTNFDCGVPALTVALRGMIAVEVEVRALTKAIHSGMWGGPVPDPVVALSKMLGSLLDDEGRLEVPGVREMVKPVTPDEEARMRKIPFDEKAFREQSGMVPGAKLLREGPNPMAQLWRFPSLTVTAVQASSRKQAGNIINDAAWARVTIRLVGDMSPEKVRELLVTHLRKLVPWGLEVEFKHDGHGAPAWAIEPKGPAYDAAISAMKKGYGVEPLMIGCGGSIPFVDPFAQALGGVPALLIGVEDPYTNAHGENESLLISDLKKACVSQVHLFAELAERLKKN